MVRYNFTNMDKAIIKLDEIEKKISYKFKIINKKDINYGRQFTLEIDQQSYIFRVFYNKKNEVKYDYSTIKDEHIITTLSLLLERGEAKGSVDSMIGFSEKIESVDLIVDAIGTDESGKGDYFGSLVVAGVFVNQMTEQILIAHGITDSKKISDNKISYLANIIKSQCPNMYSVIEIPPKTYNILYKQFINEKKNLNTLLAWGHAKAIEELLGKVDCKVAISDKFADERYIIGKLQEKGRTIKLVQEHRAEKYTAVAAASILARERFLTSLKKMSSEYFIEFPKGASNEVVRQAKLFTDKHGSKELRNVAKIHFKTTEQVL